MKKIGLLILILALGACADISGRSWWDARRTFVERFTTYPIVFYDSGEHLVNTEYVSEKSVKSNEILTAYVGYSVVSDKIYQIKNYETNLVKANVDGYMNSASVPGRIPVGKPIEVIGAAEIDGVEYRLIPSELDSFVYMVKPDGSFYDEMGQIRDGRLAVLDATFVPSPDNLRMEPVKVTRSEQTKPGQRVCTNIRASIGSEMFTYYDYSQYQDADMGEFEDINFPLARMTVNINGVKIKVLNADRHKLEYILLED